MGKSMFLFDFAVITTSVFAILDLVEGMYTLVAVYIGARVIDFIQEGAYSARGATIISVRSEEIAREINQHMDRGVDRKSTRLNSSHVAISYAVFCLKK